MSRKKQRTSYSSSAGSSSVGCQTVYINPDLIKPQTSSDLYRRTDDVYLIDSLYNDKGRLRQHPEPCVDPFNLPGEDDRWDPTKACCKGQWKAVFNKVSTPNCFSCGKALGFREGVLSHVIAAYFGGPFLPWNLRLLCRECEGEEQIEKKEDTINLHEKFLLKVLKEDTTLLGWCQQNNKRAFDKFDALLKKKKRIDRNKLRKLIEEEVEKTK
jgi:5-methylcytosine-specific restriction endonuclease McrA